MTTTLRIGLVLIVVGILVQQFVALEVRPRRARKAARDAEDTARVVAAFEQLKALPETTAFDPPADVVRQRLHLVVPSNVTRIPLQRDRITAESDDAFYTAPRDGSGEF